LPDASLWAAGDVAANCAGTGQPAPGVLLRDDMQSRLRVRRLGPQVRTAGELLFDGAEFLRDRLDVLALLRGGFDRGAESGQFRRGFAGLQAILPFFAFDVIVEVILL